MKIAHREIGPHVPPLIIAEVGIAHGGDVTRAIEYVHAVADAGAECVKLQTHIPEEEMTRDHPWWDTISRCALTERQEAMVRDAAHSRGLIWLSTPFSVAAVERLERLEVPAYKIGSGEVSHRPLLEAVARTGKPVIMSTGMHSIAEVCEALHVLRDTRYGAGVWELHCVSKYPPRYEDGMDLSVGVESFDGLSDHTPDIWTAIAAVGLGAQIVEKHVKLSDDDPDAEVAINMAQLAELVRASRAVWGACQPMKGTDTDLARIARHDRRDDWRRGA